MKAGVEPDGGAEGGIDADRMDSGVRDSGARDTGVRDSGVRDSGTGDTGVVRRNPNCAGTDDSGTVYVRVFRFAGDASCDGYSLLFGDD